MKRRMQLLALAIIRLVQSLPDVGVADVLGRELLRAGTQAGASYRASSRAKSPAEFAAHLLRAEQLVDETIYWLELLIEAGVVRKDDVARLLDEATEIAGVLAASVKAASEAKP